MDNKLGNESKTNSSDLLTKSIYELLSTTASLYDMARDGSLTDEMKGVMCGLIEGHFSDVSKLLDYQSTLTKEREERFKDIRKANETIRSLEEKLANSTPISGMKETLLSLEDIVYRWWEKEGFNHVTNSRYENGSLRCDLCSMLYQGDRDDEYFQKYLQTLKAMGFEFATDIGRIYEMELIDNEMNRKLLTGMIKRRFPSAKVREWKNRCVPKKNSDIFLIRYACISISDLTDIRIE